MENTNETQVMEAVVATATKPNLTRGQKTAIGFGVAAVAAAATYGVIRLVKSRKAAKAPSKKTVQE